MRSPGVITAIVIGAVIAGLLTEFFAMPPFIFLALPGILLSMAITGNVHAFPLTPVFFGNWIVYSLLVLGMIELRRRLHARKHG